MRIAYLVSQYPAPSHTFVRREVAALRAMGLAIDTYSIRPGQSLSSLDAAEEARTFCVLPASWRAVAGSLVVTLARRPRRWWSTLRATLAHRLPGVAQLARALAYFVEAMRLAVELERRGTTHVHNHFANPASHVGLAAARYLDLGWSVTLHGLSDFGGPTTPLLPQKVAAARFVATATQYGRAQVMRVSDPVHWDKVHVVRCGVEVASLPAPRRSGRRGPVELLSVARLSPEKGQLGLLEAFAKVVERGADARLVLVGGGPDEARIRAAVAARGLGDHVELRGPQPEVAVLEAMARADVFVLASFMEGLPVVLMEALALELPVVAPAVAGIPELVVHGETGLLFAAGDWDELAARMATLVADPALRARLGAVGRAQAVARFDVTRAVRPLAQLLAGAPCLTAPRLAAAAEPAAREELA